MTRIADVFPNLRTQENLVRSMSKKSSFRGSFPKQHGKRAETLLKFAWQHLYHISWSLGRQLCYKKFLLVICKISRLFINKVSAHGKYSVFNRDNLTQPYRMQLFENKKLFLNFFFFFLNLIEILNILKKKDDSHSWHISEITDPEKPS